MSDELPLLISGIRLGALFRVDATSIQPDYSHVCFRLDGYVCILSLFNPDTLCAQVFVAGAWVARWVFLPREARAGAWLAVVYSSHQVTSSAGYPGDFLSGLIWNGIIPPYILLSSVAHHTNILALEH